MPAPHGFKSHNLSVVLQADGSYLCRHTVNGVVDAEMVVHDSSIITATCHKMLRDSLK